MLLSTVFILSSCEDKLVVPDGALEEQTVDLQGVWKVSKALVNNQDITSLFDFSEVELSLQMNQGPTDFQIVSGDAPFPVLNNGKWIYDDAAYPTAMVFLSDGGERSVGFATPPISGNSTFSLSFSLGCADNTYIYQFEKQ
jgi:hypothetical protein